MLARRACRNLFSLDTEKAILERIRWRSVCLPAQASSQPHRSRLHRFLKIKWKDKDVPEETQAKVREALEASARPMLGTLCDKATDADIVLAKEPPYPRDLGPLDDVVRYHDAVFAVTTTIPVPSMRMRSLGAR